MDYSEITQRIESVFLRCCGGFYPNESVDSEDEIPARTVTVIMVGNTGGEFWRQFRNANPKDPHPINRWTRDNLTRVSEQLGADVIFPFDGPPFPPFQKWAKRAEGVYPSPIGPLIHPEYGLWHAYRGALLFKEKIELPDSIGTQVSPCDKCADKPCLTSCPVDVFSGEQFNFKACVGYVNKPDGEDCRTTGCQARRACPVGADHIYEPDQAAFHMKAFLENVERFIDD